MCSPDPLCFHVYCYVSEHASCLHPHISKNKTIRLRLQGVWNYVWKQTRATLLCILSFVLTNLSAWVDQPESYLNSTAEYPWVPGNPTMMCEWAVILASAFKPWDPVYERWPLTIRRQYRVIVLQCWSSNRSILARWFIAVVQTVLWSQPLVSSTL